MKDSKSILAYIDQVHFMVNQLRVNGEEILDTRVIEKIFQSLIIKFDYVIATIKESQNTLAILIKRLISIMFTQAMDKSKSHKLKSRASFAR